MSHITINGVSTRSTIPMQEIAAVFPGGSFHGLRRIHPVTKREITWRPIYTDENKNVLDLRSEKNGGSSAYVIAPPSSSSSSAPAAAPIAVPDAAAPPPASTSSSINNIVISAPVDEQTKKSRGGLTFLPNNNNNDGEQQPQQDELQPEQQQPLQVTTPATMPASTASVGELPPRPPASAASSSMPRLPLAAAAAAAANNNNNNAGGSNSNPTSNRSPSPLPVAVAPAASANQIDRRVNTLAFLKGRVSTEAAMVAGLPQGTASGDVRRSTPTNRNNSTNGSNSSRAGSTHNSNYFAGAPSREPSTRGQPPAAFAAPQEVPSRPTFYDQSKQPGDETDRLSNSGLYDRPGGLHSNASTAAPSPIRNNDKQDDQLQQPRRQPLHQTRVVVNGTSGSTALDRSAPSGVAPAAAPARPSSDADNNNITNSGSRRHNALLDKGFDAVVDAVKKVASSAPAKSRSQQLEEQQQQQQQMYHSPPQLDTPVVSHEPTSFDDVHHHDDNDDHNHNINGRPNAERRRKHQHEEQEKNEARRWDQTRLDHVRILFVGIVLSLGLSLACAERDEWTLCGLRTLTHAFLGNEAAGRPALVATDPLTQSITSRIYVSGQAGLWKSCVTATVNRSTDTTEKEDFVSAALQQFQLNLHQALENVREPRPDSKLLQNLLVARDWKINDAPTILKAVGLQALPMLQMCTNTLLDHASCQHQLLSDVNFTRLQILVILSLIGVGLLFVAVCLDLTEKVKVHKYALAAAIVFCWSISLSVWVLYASSATVATTTHATTHVECEMEANLRDVFASFAAAALTVADNHTKYVAMDAQRAAQGNRAWFDNETALLKIMQSNTSRVPQSWLKDPVVAVSDCKLGFSSWGWIAGWIVQTIFSFTFLFARISAHTADRSGSFWNPLDWGRAMLNSAFSGEIFELSRTVGGDNSRGDDANLGDGDTTRSAGGSGDTVGSDFGTVARELAKEGAKRAAVAAVNYAMNAATQHENGAAAKNNGFNNNKSKNVNRHDDNDDYYDDDEDQERSRDRQRRLRRKNNSRDNAESGIRDVISTVVSDLAAEGAQYVMKKISPRAREEDKNWQ